MSAEGNAMPLGAYTVLLPTRVIGLLQERAVHQGHPLEFELGLTLIQGANLQAYLCGLLGLCHPDAVDVQEKPF